MMSIHSCSIYVELDKYKCLLIIYLELLINNSEYILVEGIELGNMNLCRSKTRVKKGLSKIKDIRTEAKSLWRSITFQEETKEELEQSALEQRRAASPGHSPRKSTKNKSFKFDNLQFRFNNLLTDCKDEFTSQLHFYKDFENITNDYHLKNFKKLLPDKGGRRTLLLGLENVLIYEPDELNKKEKYDPFKFELIEVLGRYFYVRPDAEEFLNRISEIYEIVISSFYCQQLASLIMEELDKHFKIKDLVCDIYCPSISTIKVKDSRCLLNREQKNIAVADYNLLFWMNDLDKFIPVKPYIGEEKPENAPALHNLALYLEALVTARDIGLANTQANLFFKQVLHDLLKD